MRIIPSEVDPTLTFVERIRKSSVKVYKVEKEGTFYILKTTHMSDEWALEHLLKERNILTFANEVKGITHLVRSYDQLENGYALLKEYFEGTSLFNLEEPVKNPEIYSQLHRTIEDLHSIGIARLDIREPNVVVSPDFTSARIIDLGSGILLNESDRETFEKAKKQDYFNLEQL